MPWRRGRWPGLSLRAAVSAAIVLAVVLPGALMLALEAPDRRALLGLVLVQTLAAAAVLGGVLYWRVMRPIARLREQASAIAARSAGPPLPWRGDDEIGRLGLHLNEVRSRIDGLFDELERKNAQLRKMAMYDHLTGLPNRTLFRELFQHEAANARRHGRSLAMLFIDLDRFKHINDSLGHAAGDEVLLATSQRLLQALRESDLVCRHSGDEFLVLLRDGQHWETVAGAVERLLAAVETPLPLTRRLLGGGRPGGPDGPDAAAPAAPVQVSASVGVALFPRDGDEFETLVRHADLAMYQAKQSGRARYSFFRAGLDADLLGRVSLERELARAIEAGELVLHYQPVVDAHNGRLRGAEALLRWHHPRRGLLLPAAFMDAAEERGLMRELGSWTFDRICEQISRWRSLGLEPVRVAVNVSAAQLQDPGLAEIIGRALGRHGVPPEGIELELTESALMRDDDSTRRLVESLRAQGTPLVVDGFGTGYSSMSYLKRLRPDKLKIDRSFVQDLPDDADDRALTQAILAMARALGITVVAEGVDTAAQRRYLGELGCPLVQGGIGGEPMTPPAFEQRLRAQGRDSVPAPSTA